MTSLKDQLRYCETYRMQEKGKERGAFSLMLSLSFVRYVLKH